MAALLSACAGASGGPSRSAAARVSRPARLAPQATISPEAPGRLRRAALPEPGTGQQVDAAGAMLTVTLRRVIDPLRGSGAVLDPRTRAIGVIVQIRNAGPGIYDSSATGDISLIASSGVVTPVLATHGICRTPVQDFDRYITPGEDRIGCVVFAVPDAATLDAVRFSPHAHRRGRLTWGP
jgi:hypothetical protein